ncbi:MAG: DUF2878 domain-containing protein [Deltaproteobacteria bacterium]|nr:DUF2878 domain-containing protein [Deltaproteobacteria bacterium]
MMRRGLPRGGLTGSRLWMLADFAAQQGTWWFAVILVRLGHPEIAWLGASATVLGHLAIGPVARAKTAGLALFAAGLGFGVDTLLIGIGVLDFPSARLASSPDLVATMSVSPAWMVGLWAAFGVSLLNSLAKLTAKPLWVVGLLGGLAGVVAYRAGEAMDVLTIELGVAGHLAVCCAWALALVALALAARWLSFDRVRLGGSRGEVITGVGVSEDAHGGI